MFGIFILIDKFEEVIFVTLDMVESEGQLWLLQLLTIMPLCNKINVKWYLGYYFNLLEKSGKF